MRTAFFLLVFSASALAQAPISILQRDTLRFERPSPGRAYELSLTAAYLEGAGWSGEDIRAIFAQSSRILSQCDVGLAEIRLVRIGAPPAYLDFSTATARELARALPLPKPAVYFVADTRQRPAFDAEAIGRGNSAGRPELADTVWVTRATRDPGVAVAHELAHVLMNSGAHSQEDGNLMRDETAPDNVRLTQAQCARLRSTAVENGLIRSAR